MAAETDDRAARTHQRSDEVEAFVREYIRLWNARDLGAIWSRIYRLEAGHRYDSEAHLRATVEQLVSEGFDRTELHSVEGWALSPTEAEARIRYTRIRKDGSAMQPANRGAKYLMRRFDDGWRITQLMPIED